MNLLLFPAGCASATIMFLPGYRKSMLAPLSSATFLGLPLAIVFGILTVICLFATALAGYLVMKGRFNIPFAWHLRLAALTVVLAIIHGILVLAWLTG